MLHITPKFGYLLSFARIASVPWQMGIGADGESHRDIESSDDARREAGGPGPKINYSFLSFDPILP